MSRGRNVQGPKRLGAEMSRCRNVLGAETSTCRNVLDAETSSCRNVLGAETFGPKRPLPKFFGPKPDEAELTFFITYTLFRESKKASQYNFIAGGFNPIR